MDIAVETPAFFICPISLLIMKDPVTAVTGITYDRESIEKWVLDGDNTFCPVTNLPLPRDSDLTPNHTLRRLIQAWCTANAAFGVDRIPTPKTPLSKVYAVKLVRDLSRPRLRLKTLQKLEMLAMEKESNRKSMVEAGVVKELLSCLIGFYKKDEKIGLEQTLYVLYLIRGFSCETTNKFIAENDNLLDAILWVLDCAPQTTQTAMKSHALCVMKTVVGKANPAALERLLTPEILKKIVNFLKDNNTITKQGLHAALKIMLEICLLGRNRVRMVESGAVFELIELELNLSPAADKKTTELVLGILFHLCSCADGRARLLSHAAGIAVVTRKILKVSPAADDRAVLILSLISRFSATSGVLQEMLRVGTVAKLCMVLQAGCESYLKDKAKEILRTHFDVWKNSPCVEVATLTRYLAS
ncbi:PREDICTED: E3 ubiquitin-protein ligase PUB24-like [Ipomoea nil]|uniref:E3 ubiquitin-protein ligase PUB24-like n=1 Tax=Ipomoea nil TaxID=35883 RepID=UPI00090155B4|nr:PREDICTED: E3 ubiquitin-protein ligase PUB24-like [Ipomoea nil]